MNDKQVRIFYFVIFIIIVLIFLFWSFFLKNKWQESEVAVINLEPYSAMTSGSQTVGVEQKVVVVETPKEVAVIEGDVVLPESDDFWGNRGYTTKDGKSTYRPMVKESEDELDDE